MGRYIVRKCQQHWLWEGKVDSHKRCKGCNRSWMATMKSQEWQQDWFTQQSNKPMWKQSKKPWRKPTYKEALLEPPPGLGATKILKGKGKKWKDMEDAATQHWDSLPGALRRSSRVWAFRSRRRRSQVI